MSDEDLIDDQYQTVMCIASGSSSQVWEVVEKTSARHMAMKLLKQDVPEFKQNKAQLKRESEIMKTLDHPNIIKFERFSSSRDHTYILMEHFRASNLKLQIKSETNKVHLKVRGLFEGICAALSHVHMKGYIHRDIKPDNVLMNKVGEVRLCDFSLSSKQVKGFGKMLAGKLKSIQGTRTYIAPETIRRAQPTIQTDLYSLGILFFEVLTCRTPFQAPSPEELLQKHLRAEPPNASEFNPNVSPEMDRVIAKLLKKKPADRPASVDEVLSELKRIRIFKEDVVDEAALKQANENADLIAMVSEVRLDSRADAKLKHLLETNEEFAQKFLTDKTAKDERKAREMALHKKRVLAAETAQAKRGKPAAEAPAAVQQPQPQPQMVPMPMPMPMPGYPPGYQPFPQGYAQYPQPQMMPMQPGMMPPPPGAQYPAQPAGYPPQVQQPSAAPPQVVNTAPPAAAAPQRQQPERQQPAPVQLPPAASQQQPAAPRPQQPKAAAPTRPAAEPKPTTPQKPPARQPAAPGPAGRQQTPAATQKPAAPKAVPSPIARPVARATPPSADNADLDFMTELPDVM